MAEVSVSVRPSYRDVAGKFVKADETLLQEKRDMMRGLGQTWVRMARNEAPRKTGSFADGIRFQTRQQGEEIRLTTSLPQPLGTFITEGTKAHKIAAKVAGALAFFFGKIGMFTIVPKNGGFPTHVRKDGTLMVGKGFVNHPGTKANPFTDRVFEKWMPLARQELGRITVNWRNNATS